MSMQDGPSDLEKDPQQEKKHPDEWSEDLNPDRLAGQNTGPEAEASQTGDRTAYDVKDLHRRLDEFSDQVLKKIPIVPEGTRLQQGATYIDLQDVHPAEFTAEGTETADSDQRYVAKDHVPYRIWNRLIEEEKPGRGG